MAESDGLFRRLFENTTEAVLIADADTGLIVDTNRRGAAMLGRTPAEIVGKHQTFIHPSEEAERYRRMFNTLQRDSAADHQVNIIRKDGTVIPAMISASIITIDGRKLVLGFFHDLSEHRRVERELGVIERRYRDLADSLPEIVFEVDTSDNLTFVNRNGLRSFGYAKSDLERGVNFRQMLVPEARDMAARRFQQIVRGKRLKPIEYVVQRKNGGTFTVLLYSRPIRREGKIVGARGIAVDVTAQARSRQNMRLYVAEVAKAQEEERKRLARELHDDTLQALTMLSVEIKAMSEDRTRPQGEILSRLTELGARADDIVDGVRRLSKSLRPEVLDQLGLLPALEYLVGEMNKNGKTTTRLELTGNERRLAADPELVLYRVIQEALSNIVKHASATEAVVRLRYLTQRVKVDVTDNGVGFDMPVLLTDFARCGKLGLVGMRERVRLLNGKVTVKSRPGKGTTVSAELSV